MQKFFAIACLMILGSNALAISPEHSPRGSITYITQKTEGQNEVISGVMVTISNGVAPQESVGEVVRKDTGETLAVMSLPPKVPALFKLDPSCDYVINYKELRFGIAVSAIAMVPNSCGQQRLQAR